MADSKMADGKTLATQVAPVQNASKPKQVHYPFWFGGSASCFAAGVTHPLDLVKVISNFRDSPFARDDPDCDFDS
ncbi:hypothetical protein MYU51_012437 [Penicillium brevicompactum]